MAQRLKWGVLGVGIAGKARAEAIRRDPRAIAVGGYRGDPERAGLPAYPSAQALLDEVDGVVVSASDTAHPELVELALKAGKHVVCDFPLAGSAADAQRLYALADWVDRVLHVEHIELLSPTTRWIASKAAGQLASGEVVFRNRVRDRVWSLANQNVSRLHRIRAIAGELSVEHHEAGAGIVRGELRAGGVPVRFEFTAREGDKRHMAMRWELRDGSVIEVDGRQLTLDGERVEMPRSQGLFYEDQLAASALILDGAEPYIDRQGVVAVLALADSIG